MKLIDLKSALEKSWSMETCFPGQKEEWSDSNPAFGQCAITALIIQDFFKGRIAYTPLLHHYWNILPDNSIVDFTEKQFNQKIDRRYFEIKSREYILNSARAQQVKTRKRYEALKRKVNELLIEKVNA